MNINKINYLEGLNKDFQEEYFTFIVKYKHIFPTWFQNFSRTRVSFLLVNI